MAVRTMGVAAEAAEAMEAYILETGGGVSMVELERVAGEHLDTSGDLAWVAPDDANLVAWAGMSQGFIDALNAMRERGKVEAGGTSPLVYLAGGKVPRYPVAQRPPKGGYKSEHWLPVVFNPREAR